MMFLPLKETKQLLKRVFLAFFIFINNKSTNVPTDKTNKVLTLGVFWYLCFFVFRGRFSDFIFLLKNCQRLLDVLTILFHQHHISDVWCSMSCLKVDNHRLNRCTTMYSFLWWCVVGVWWLESCQWSIFLLLSFLSPETEYACPLCLWVIHFSP